MERKIYRFEGKITANTNLTVSRQGDEFFQKGLHESTKITRIPRCGVKEFDAPGYFPSGSILGVWRRCTTDVLRLKEAVRLGTKLPFSLDTKYLLSQGMLLGPVKRAQAAPHKSVTPGSTEALRNKNPALSLHGRWQLAANWCVDNMYTTQSDAIQLVGAKYRTNEYIRSPEQVEFLSETDQDWLKKVFVHDQSIQDAKAKSDMAIKEVNDLLKSEDDPNKKKKYEAELKKLKEAAKSNKVAEADKANGFVESIMHPVSQYEVIRRGSVLDHTMKIQKATKLELGLVLATLRYFSINPTLGGHSRDCCGEIKGYYTVKGACFDTGENTELGKVIFGPMKFEFEEGSSGLEEALEYFDQVALNFEEHDIDLTIAGIPE